MRFSRSVQWLTPVLGLVVALGCSRGTTRDEPRATREALPVTVVSGAEPGPTIAFVAGVHGGKMAAVRAVEQLRRELPAELRRGRVLLLAPANAAGFRAGLAQTSPDDSLNLNRVFPGNANGRPTERLAAAIMRQIVAESNYLVDMHGSDGDESVGSFAYAARPGVNPPVDNSALQLAHAWGVPVILRDEEGPRLLAYSRFLQTAAHLSNVPAITVFEAGSTREDSSATAAFVRGARATLQYFGMLDRQESDRPPASDAASVASAPQDSPTLFSRRVITTAPTSGHWQPSVEAGAQVQFDELLGVLRTLSGSAQEIRAAEAGLVLHQRRTGDVTAGTALMIAGTAAPRSAPLTRP